MVNKEINHKKRLPAEQTRITLLFVLGVLLASIALVLFVPGFSADSSVIPPKGELGVPIPGSSPVTNFYEYVTAVIEFCTTTLGPMVAVIMIMYGGYRYIFSQGDNTAMTEGKNIIYGAIWGYLILFMTKFIVSVIGV
jgi:hypothetical protein